jgi:phosphomannomutase
VVGRDTRESGPAVEAALAAGIAAEGGSVDGSGVITTPGVACVTRLEDYDAGVVISASHNPYRDNGIKVFSPSGRKLDDAAEREIERLVAELAPSSDDAPSPLDEKPSHAARYLDYLRDEVAAGLDLSGVRLAIDCANGAAYELAPALFRSLGAEVHAIGVAPDGRNINEGCGSLHLDALRAAVVERGADLGVAFDGDADRAAFVDETGEALGSDLATALIAGELLAKEPGKHVVYDLRSSRATAEWIREKGGIPVRERVGHSFMKATLRRLGGIMGGVLAGHYYFRDMYHADSALLAVVHVLNLLWESGQKMSQLVAPLHRYAKSPEINFEVEDKEGMMRALASRYSNGEIDHLDGVTVQYPDWWFNVRPSNTEPLLRLVLEAKTPEDLDKREKELIGQLGEPVSH